PYRLGSQHHPVEHEMGSRLEQQLVLAADRLPLGPVGDDHGPAASVGDDAHLPSHGKAGPPSPAEAAGVDSSDQSFPGAPPRIPTERWGPDPLHVGGEAQRTLAAGTPSQEARKPD